MPSLATLASLMLMLVSTEAPATSQLATPEVAPRDVVPAQPAERTSVMVLPIRAAVGVSPDLAALVSSGLALEMARAAPVRVMSFAELEGSLSHQQVKDLVGCDSSTCMAEIAGALNTDEVIMGTLGVVGQSYALSLARVRARDAQTLTRVIQRYPRNDDEAVLDGLPAVTRELLGLPAMAAAQPPIPSPAASVSPRTANAAPTAAPEAPRRSRLEWPLRLVGGAGALLGGLLLPAGAALGTAFAVVAGYDFARGDPRGGVHAIGQSHALMADGALVLGILLGVAGVPTLLVALGILAASWVAP